MSREPSLPVVIGSSFSGLLVSWSLSQQGIQHVLIGGDAPPAKARLGESMNEGAGVDLWRTLGEDSHKFFVKKNHISVFDREVATAVHIGNPRESLDSVSRRVLRNGRIRIPLGRTLLVHVDRTHLDPLLYERATRHPCCRFVHGLVQDLAYDKTLDTFTRLTLVDGTVFDRPKYVFDGTGGRSLLGTAAGVEVTWTSPSQRVAWSHLTRSETPRGPKPWWEFGSNILRLRASEDGVNGVAWIIPLANSLSLGVSVDADDPHAAGLDHERLFDTLVRAATRRGLDVGGRFPIRGTPQEVKNRYFVRDRAFGANWLLVGGAFIQAWFPTAAGVWTSTHAATIAPALLKDPLKPAQRYEQAMRGLLGPHRHVGQFVHGDGFQSKADGYWFWSRWLAFIPKRLQVQWREVNGDFARRRGTYSIFRRGTHMLLKRPRLQLMVWGNIAIRCRQAAEPGQLAEQFEGYQGTLRFRLSNYIQGLPQLLPWRRRHPRPWTLDEVRDPPPR